MWEALVSLILPLGLGSLIYFTQYFFTYGAQAFLSQKDTDKGSSSSTMVQVVPTVEIEDLDDDDELDLDDVLDGNSEE